MQATQPASLPPRQRSCLAPGRGPGPSGRCLSAWASGWLSHPWVCGEGSLTSTARSQVLLGEKLTEINTLSSFSTQERTRRQGSFPSPCRSWVGAPGPHLPPVLTVPVLPPAMATLTRAFSLQTLRRSRSLTHPLSHLV